LVPVLRRPQEEQRVWRVAAVSLMRGCVMVAVGTWKAGGRRK
jgi:hypothetical protein